MPFGQLVIGPPGCGKTTYCNGVQQFLELMGRKVAVVNLDPANDVAQYEFAIDIGELVAIEEVQQKLDLGPNGGLVYCMDYLKENIEWLDKKLDKLEKEGYYFLFDCPGQVELFTLSGSFKEVANHLTNDRAHRLVAVHLVDAHLCSDPYKYVSALVLSLSTMLHLELPHVNVLSKMDLIKQYGDLAFRLDYYTEVQDLSFLQKLMEGSAFSERLRALTGAICEIVEDFGLVGFTPLAIEDKESVAHLMGIVDKANGYVFAQMGDKTAYPEIQYANDAGTAEDIWQMYQKKYVDKDVKEHETE